MKAKIARDDIEVVPALLPPGHEGQWEHKNIRRNGRMQDVPHWKMGAIVDMPDSHKLVAMGCAIPADEECQLACGMTIVEIRAALRAQDKVSLGIHPHDYEKFDNGEIEGYNPDGSYKPGPNFKAEAAEVPPLYDAHEDEEDEH